MKPGRPIGFSLAVLFAILCVVGENRFVAPAAAARRVPTTLEQELAFYPSGRMLRQVSAGFQNVAADILWLRAIQYYGEHRKTDLVFDKAAHVFRVLTDLDPHFVEAYRFGALVVIEDARDPDAGFELLRKGIRENPGSWELAFDLGLHHFLRGEYGRAASYFRRAASLRPESEQVARFAAYAEKKRGGLDSSEEMWREILASTENERFREAAEAALRGIQAARDTTVLAASARLYRERFGAFPTRPEDLVRAGILASAPAEPYGERYVIHPETGEVQSSYLLAREIRQEQRVLQRLVEDFRAEHDRSPANLEEIVVAGFVPSIPSPWGVRFSLDPETDSVRVSMSARAGRAAS